METWVLTRLEVDGFKNLQGFSVDFGPLTCIAGPNGVGKSNIFDAIRFVSLLCDHTIIEAALLVRGSQKETSGIRDLFWSDGARRADRFKIAVEMLVPKFVADDFGRDAEATSTFLRYEVEIALEDPGARRSLLGGLVLVSEDLSYITQGHASDRLRFPHSAKKFRSSAVINNRKAPSGFISSQSLDSGHTEIKIHQDGGSRGPAQTASAASAPRTVVGTSNTAFTPTILAARREMQSWRVLALEPSAMRSPDRFDAKPHLTDSGGHLPATLFRLANDGDKGPAVVYAELASKLARLVSVRGLRVNVDEVRQLLSIEVTERSGVSVPATSLSDGTLRFLVLVLMSIDAQATGVVCMEEPENGIHPAKIPDMVSLLRELAVDAHEEPSGENPFRQLIVATHSPQFVQLQERDDLIFASEVRVKGGDGACSTMRCKPLVGSWRADQAGVGAIGLSSILAYLSAPKDAQLRLPNLQRDAVSG